MKFDLKIVIIILAVSTAGSYLYNINLGTPEEEVTAAPSVKIGGEVIFVEVADTPELLALGLSYRKSLEDNVGMLFVFDSPRIPGFWMKEMNFPIDIIWINSNGEILEITENALPESYPQIFRPENEVSYVLEVNSGFVQKNNITAGNVVVIEI